MTSGRATHSAPDFGLQVHMQKSARSITDRVRSEVDNTMAVVGNRTRDATSAAIDSLAVSGVELAVKSVRRSSGRDPGTVVFHPDQKGFSGNTRRIPMTASCRLKSNTNLSEMNETRGSNTVEVGELPVYERSADWQTHTHHSCVNFLTVLH